MRSTLSRLIADKRPGTVLLKFNHGLGDLIMFLPVVSQLERMYPFIRFSVGIEDGMGYEEIIDRYHILGKDESKFDLVFPVDLKCSEPSTSMTKIGFCCKNELGVPAPSQSHARLDPQRSPLVGVHFHSTCLPDSVSASKEVSEMVWNEILEFGLVPVDTHFNHKWSNPKNSKFDFVECSVRKCKPSVKSLIGLIQACRAFIGVSSGNLHVAISVLPPQNVMMIENGFSKIGCYTDKSIRTISGSTPSPGAVKAWLRTV